MLSIVLMYFNYEISLRLPVITRKLTEEMDKKVVVIRFWHE
jgi:hypothetical protein